MKHHPIAYAVLVAAITVLCMSAFGESESTVSPESVVSELSGIRVALEGLSVQVLRMRRSTDADLVLRQIQLYEQRVAPLERQLAVNNREYLDNQTWLGSAKERLAQAKKRVADAERESRENVPEDLLEERDAAAQSVEHLKARIETLRDQQLVLEDKIAESRKDIEILEERLLGLLDTD